MTGAGLPAVQLDRVCWGPCGDAGILSGISFSVPQGQVMAICGVEDAGKSALLQLILRQQAPRQGTVRLMGRDIWLMDGSEVARGLAAVVQDQPRDFALTVRQVVALGRLPHRRRWGTGLSTPDEEDARVVGAALRRLDLTAMAERPFGALSGAARQRVMVARALAQEARVIVLDGSANPLGIRRQLDLLARLKGPGVTVIAALHARTLAAGLADRVLVLSGGRILSDAPPGAALTRTSLPSVEDPVRSTTGLRLRR